VLLIELVANATLGWSSVDPLIGLVIAAVAAREGIHAWRGDACCDLPIPGQQTGRQCDISCCDP
jgi:Co/Zn/Cd efflux system component